MYSSTPENSPKNDSMNNRTHFKWITFKSVWFGANRKSAFCNGNFLSSIVPLRQEAQWAAVPRSLSVEPVRAAWRHHNAIIELYRGQTDECNRVWTWRKQDRGPYDPSCCRRSLGETGRESLAGLSTDSSLHRLFDFTISPCTFSYWCFKDKWTMWQ